MASFSPSALSLLDSTAFIKPIFPKQTQISAGSPWVPIFNQTYVSAAFPTSVVGVISFHRSPNTSRACSGWSGSCCLGLFVDLTEGLCGPKLSHVTRGLNPCHPCLLLPHSLIIVLSTVPPALHDSVIITSSAAPRNAHGDCRSEVNGQGIDVSIKASSHL